MLPRKLRRHKRTEGITGNWTWGDITLGDTANDSLVYFNDSATTVTFPTDSFSGFAIGDVITISGRANEKVKRKKKVHVARRRKQEKLDKHTITDITETTLTISTDESVILTYLYDGWKASICAE
jgi:hypothetical protein